MVLNAAILMFLGLLSLGMLIFGSKEELEFKLWFYPWLLLSLITSVNLYMNVYSSALENFGKLDIVSGKGFRHFLESLLFAIMIVENLLL